MPITKQALMYEHMKAEVLKNCRPDICLVASLAWLCPQHTLLWDSREIESALRPMLDTLNILNILAFDEMKGIVCIHCNSGLGRISYLVMADAIAEVSPHSTWQRP